MKHCNKCDQDKPDTEFAKRKTSKDGLHPYCKPCERAYQNSHRQANKARANEQARKSYQKHREERLRQGRERYWANLEESREYHRQKANRLRVNYLDRLREAEQRRRDRVAAAPGDGLTKAQWREILENFNHCCAYCLEPCEKLETDHFYPLMKGGAHDVSNIVPACRRCNAIKKDRLIFEWLPMMERSGILSPKKQTEVAA